MTTPRGLEYVVGRMLLCCICSQAFRFIAVGDDEIGRFDQQKKPE